MNSPVAPPVGQNALSAREQLRQLLLKKVSTSPQSFEQRRLWFIEGLGISDVAYTHFQAIRLRGRLDSESLERAFRSVIGRHEILRTTFANGEGGPVQVVHPTRAFALAVDDLSALAEAQRESAIAQAIDAVRSTPFDLERGPLLRCRLLMVGEREQVLLLAMHHIVVDGWSAEVLFRELSALYRGYSRGEEVTLDALPVQYADFAAWQRAWLGSAESDRQLAYWREQLAGMQTLQLPHDRARGAVQTFAGAQVARSLREEVVERLRSLSRGEGVTLFMTLLAGFVVLMQRYSQQDDVVIGTPVANRAHKELEGLIGFFVNTLVLRSDVSGDPTFTELLGRVRETALQAYAHQEVPFEKLVDVLQPERDLSRNPLFQVAFALQREALDALELDGLRVSRFPVAAATSHVDIECHVIESQQGCVARLVYNTELFDAVSMERLLDQYARLLDVVAARPGIRLADIDLLTAHERNLVLVEWNTVSGSQAPALTVLDAFRSWVGRQPDALAVKCGDTYLSYADLDAQAGALARALQARGVMHGDRVGICVERGPSLVAGMLGIWKAGAAYLPLDPEYPQARLGFMLDDAQPRCVVTHASLMQTLRAASEGHELLDVVELLQHDEANPEQRDYPSPDDLAYMIYTSGSTGNPKGVLLRHRGLGNVASEQVRVFGVGPGHRVLQFSSPSFDAGTFDVVMALGSGATLVMAEPAAMQPGPVLAQLLEEESITLLTIPPSALGALPDVTLPSLAVLNVAGEACSAQLVARWLVPGRKMFNLYGPTEGTIWSTVAPCVADGHVPAIGRPIANVPCYVVDSRGHLAPVGVPGELHVGGAGVAAGYWHRDALTAERFVADPFTADPHARMYRTGDRVRWRADGQLDFLGRIDSQVKLRGYRIELGEIEHTLSSHAQVREAVVMVREDVPGDRRLVGYVVCDDGGMPKVSPAELRAHVRNRLPGYMVPHAVVELGALPLTPNGKIDRDALPPPGGDRQTDQAYMAPRTELERRIAAIWCDVLRVDQVGVYDNFFELGGDSIMSLQIVSRAKGAGLGITSKQIFLHQTVAELAAVSDSVASPTAVETSIRGDVALTPIQAWFFDQQMASRHHFNQSVLLQFGQPLDASVVQRALQHLLAHHDALRARFVNDQAGWRQHVAMEETADLLQRVRLPGCPVDGCRDELRPIVADLHRSLDITSGPLLRAALIEYADDTPQQLLVVVHHLVVDGVSWQVLLEDLETLCRQLAAGDEAQLPNRTSSVQAFANALASYAAGEVAGSQLGHWLTASEGGSGMLPRDRQAPPSANRWGDVCAVEVQLTGPETRRLLTHAVRRFRVRINDLLLTALALTLADASGRRRVHIDLEGHGREDDLLGIDSTRTVGWFTALYPVALSLPDGGGIVDALGAVKRQLECVPDGGLGYGCLRYLCPEPGVRGRLAGSATPEVSFNYRGRVDQALADDAFFAMLPEDNAAAGLDPLAERAHLVDVSGRVLDGGMRFLWFFSPALHERATVEHWASVFAVKLRAIVAACDRSEPHTQTPADFPLAALTPAQLQRLQKGNTGISDIYPATPLQAGILFRTLESSAPGVYLPQFVFELSGDLDVAYFKRAWQILVDRHDILRTAFAWVGLDHPLQVVRKHAEVTLAEADWRDVADDAERDQLEGFLANDLGHGFVVDDPPLLRLALLRRDASRWLLVWTMHHLVLDGWCLPLILSEVLNHYRGLCHGEPGSNHPAPVYRDYIAWLQRADLPRARAFWREYLGDFHQVTEIGIGFPPEEIDGPTHAELRRDLSETFTARVQQLARTARVTLNTVTQGAWALLLSRYSGESDVVFGVTVSGRAADVPGIESMLGLFINGLPMRVAVTPGAPLLPWLAGLQKDQVYAREYEATSLLQIQEWIGWTAGTPLFETVVVFENYPMQGGFERAVDGLSLRYHSSRGWTDVPIEVVVIPGERLCIRIKYDQRSFEREDVEQVLDHFVALLNDMTLNPSNTLASCSMAGTVMHP